MGRIRSVHPEFFTDEDIAGLSDAAQIVLIGLWTLADDLGAFEWKPAGLKMKLRPASTKPIEPVLEELLGADRILRYDHAGKSYGLIRNFRVYQRPKAPKSRFFIPPELRNFTGTGDLITEIPIQMERRGEEDVGKGEDGGETPPPVPFAEIVGAYNRLLTDLPKVRDLTTDRKEAIRKAWQHPQRRTVEFWVAYFEECAADDFLSGKGPYREPHANWRPDFDFLLRQKTITKTFERAMHRLEQQAARV